MFNPMKNNFKSPVSTISPRGHSVDNAAFSGELAPSLAPPDRAQLPANVGTDARKSAQRTNKLPKILLCPEFQAVFWAKTKAVGACVEWQASFDAAGYGRVRGPSLRTQYRAHRVAYFMATGDDPGDLHVCHTCDNPPCVNPAHLFLGTDAMNVADKMAKGRWVGVDQRGEANGAAKVCVADVRRIVAEIMAGKTNVNIAQTSNVGHAMISRIRVGRAWREVADAMGYIPVASKQAPKSGRTKAKEW